MIAKSDIEFFMPDIPKSGYLIIEIGSGRYKVSSKSNLRSIRASLAPHFKITSSPMNSYFVVEDKQGSNPMRRKKKNPHDESFPEHRERVTGPARSKDFVVQEFTSRGWKSRSHVFNRKEAVDDAEKIAESGAKARVMDWNGDIIYVASEMRNPMRRKRKNPISDLNRYINTPVEKWPFRLKSYSANADGMVNSGILKSGKHFYKKWTYSNGRHSNPRFVLEGERDYGNNPRRRKTRRNHAMLTKGHVRSGAVSSKTLATRRYDAVRAPYSKIHKALMTSMSRGGGQYEALAALRGKRSGMSLSRNPKRRKKNKRGRK